MWADGWKTHDYYVQCIELILEEKSRRRRKRSKRGKGVGGKVITRNSPSTSGKLLTCIFFFFCF